MEDVFETSLLLDFYGQLITARQYEILDLHCNNDYTLGEIAEQLNISRQGVHDNIRRARATLQEIEGKLGLVKKFAEQKRKSGEILAYINQMNPGRLDPEEQQLLKKIKAGVEELMTGF